MSALPSLARSPKLLGRCNICGQRTFFAAHSDNWRESLLCMRCGSYARKRQLAQVIMDTYFGPGLRSFRDLPWHPSAQSLKVYLAGSSGPMHDVLSKLPGYTCSEYMPGVHPGTVIDGVRCEDLQRLTFPDEQFDLVITEDVMEHVRHSESAWQEIRRVLKPGGHHVFTTPLDTSLPRSVRRVDSSGPEDVLLMSAVYHGNRGYLGDARMLVYSDFGADLPEHLSSIGMPTEIICRRDVRKGILGPGAQPICALRSRRA